MRRAFMTTCSAARPTSRWTGPPRTAPTWPGRAACRPTRAHWAVLGRMVRYLARDAEVRQFLDIGTGIPKEDKVHEVAQREAPQSRVVYVDRDPIVLAH